MSTKKKVCKLVHLYIYIYICMFRCFFLAKQRNCSVFIEAKSLENVHRHFVLERFNDFIYIKIN